jgi:pimeloyl-[acyl-carrier protein] methyl ester esterase
VSIEQAINCKVIGQGPALVLLHGWGVNSAVWQPVIEQLSEHCCLYIVDLPGFGDSEPLDEYSFESICLAIFDVVPESAIWCGWSLGGLIATHAAIHYPQRVTKLVQVASSIKFVADAQWVGVDAAVFDNFLLGLQTNPQKTLTRFIALQAMGCESARKDSSTIKKLLSGTKEADPRALVAGLKLLAESDFRSEFGALSQPCFALLGVSDGLIPLQASQDMKAILPHLQVQLFENASHAPFISEGELFCEKIINIVVG